MFKHAFRSLSADLARPWGPWTKFCIGGSCVSLAYLLLTGRSYYSSRLIEELSEWGVVIAVTLLLASVAAGLIALTRPATSKVAPLLALCLIVAIGWPFILMGVVEFSYFVFARLIGSILTSQLLIEGR